MGGVPLFGGGAGSGSAGGTGGAGGEGPAQPPGSGAGPGAAGVPTGAGAAGPGAGAPPAGFSGTGAPSGAGFGGGAGGPVGAPMGNSRTITAAIAYAKAHGGGTVAVSSQSSAASEIVDRGAEVAGIGGFSGRESDVSVAWLAGEVSRGQIRWVLVEGSGSRGPRLPGDTRQGSRRAMTAVSKACTKVTLSASASGGEGGAAGGQSGESALYDCRGQAAALSSGA